ncbi:MAG: hypothetical protein M3346_03455 [Actinomycetota bacterium]|nr:hypothetical protein [Actinomycetota bacterium]
MPDPPLASYEDDLELQGDIRLIRWISGNGVVWKDTAANEVQRVKSWSFQLQKDEVARDKGYPRGCVSLGLESIILGQYASLAADVCAARKEGMGVAVLTAEIVRLAGFGLQLVPEIDEPWHVAAFLPEDVSKNAVSRASKRLARDCVLIDPPEGDLVF